MPAWAWILIAIAVIAVAVGAWQVLQRRRTQHLQERFGPEYDRTLQTSGDQRAAETELQQREERRKELDIKPLDAAAHERYVAEWKAVQAQFVDDPSGAVDRGDTLIQRVMGDRGYPVEDFEQRAADVSVDHPQVVEHYRQGHRLATSGEQADTERLRQAMRHYRALFDELVEPTADEPLAREPQPETSDGRKVQRG
jgi:hypothetical protein